MKSSVFRREGHKKTTSRGDCLKKKGLGRFADLGDGLVKKRRWCL